MDEVDLYKMLSDERLVELFQASSTEEGELIFQEIYARHSQPTFGHIKSKIGDEDWVEDIHAEVWLAVVKGIAALKIKATFKSWLWAIARHKIAEFYRTKKKEAETLQQADLKDEQVPEDLRDILFKDEGHEQDKREELVRKALAELRKVSPESQEVIELSLLGFNNQEIAEIVEKKPGAIRTARSRAIKRLQRIIDDIDHNGVCE